MFDGFTDSGKKVRSLARQETRKVNHEYIGTEHILLGCVLALYLLWVERAAFLGLLHRASPTS